MEFYHLGWKRPRDHRVQPMLQSLLSVQLTVLVFGFVLVLWLIPVSTRAFPALFPALGWSSWSLWERCSAPGNCTSGTLGGLKTWRVRKWKNCGISAPAGWGQCHNVLCPLCEFPPALRLIVKNEVHFPGRFSKV